MKGLMADYFADLEEQGSSVAMDVDDVDSLEMFGEGVLPADNKLAESDFFNSFEDDFDDSDIN
ncbi:small acidic protein 1 [Malania oleifera]|uniref:small acidic protein 1 n=1 Tax=Malania oleifera TaxID=397392 RepID=UPI0025AE614B|nr:small acidic protein 1 [Malania oleifera]